MDTFGNIISGKGEASQAKRHNKKVTELQKCTLKGRGKIMQKICASLKSDSTDSNDTSSSSFVGFTSTTKKR